MTVTIGEPMKIVIPGGSGQVGRVVARAFHGDGHEVVVLSRSPGGTPWRTVGWDGETRGDWVREIDGADVVLNLAGRSVNCRYHERNRRQILDSRVLSTRVVGQAISESPHPPGVWLQMSTATLYAHTYGPPHDEVTGRVGGEEPGAPDTWRFSIEVATAWEKELAEASTPDTRKVAMRSAMVMSPDRGGIFDTLLRLVRFGLGGKVGDGKQFVSWIHERDFVRAVRWLIDHDEITGPINLASPEPLPFTDFMRALRQAWGIRLGLPATTWMLEIGAFFLRTESELVLKSRRVVPGLLVEQGFVFDFPAWPDAAEELCGRWRAGAG